MTATINASTTAGVVTTADTSGILQLQTNGTAALTVDASQRTAFVAGTAALPAITTTGDTNTGIFFPAADTIAFAEGGAEAMRIDSSAQVGIGTSSPGAKLDVSNGTMRASQTSTASTSLVYATNSGGGNVGFWKQGSTAGSYGVIAAENGAVFNSSGDLCIVNDASSKNIIFANNGAASERMRIDSSGNVGIGTSSPAGKLAVSDGTVIGEINPFSAASGCYIGTRSNHALLFQVNASEKARIDTSGNLLVGTTSQTPGYGNTNTGQQLGGSGVSTFSRGATDFVIVCNQNTADGSTFYQMQFRVSNVSKGSITSTSSATSYNTSSDYRLKNTIAPMTGALDKVALLKPRTYKWNIDGSDGQGFIAHELAEVVPDCVTGEKDAVQEEQYEVTPAVKDEEGRVITEAVMGTRTVPSYQGIDTSFLVATLSAAIQELKAIVDGQAVLIAAQGAEIAALKGATA